MKARLALSIALAMVFVSISFPPAQNSGAFASATPPKMLTGAVPDAVSQRGATLVGQVDASATMSIAVGLGLRNRAALDSFLQAAANPASPAYRTYLTQDQVNQEFNPTPGEEQQVIDWLHSNGLRVTRTYANHLLVDAQGTTSQVERMLRVTINNYRGRVMGSEREFFAPASAPQIDGSVSSVVQTITGLDNYPRFHLLSNGAAHKSPPYYPQDFANAYDVNPLWSAGSNGSGQHIGITLWTVPPSDTTLQRFGTVTGAAVATTANHKLNVIKVDGGTNSTVSPDSGEAGMDIESSGGMAPSATIDYYEAQTDASGNPTDIGLEDALNLAGSDANNNLQISSSWGECEPSSGDPFEQATNNIFASNSATGHTYFFSSGDNGSWCDPGNGGTDPYPDYPTSDPYVTSVGGTAFNANGQYLLPG